MAYELRLCILIITLQGCYAFAYELNFMDDEGNSYTCHYFSSNHSLLWPFVSYSHCVLFSLSAKNKTKKIYIYSIVKPVQMQHTISNKLILKLQHILASLRKVFEMFDKNQTDFFFFFYFISFHFTGFQSCFIRFFASIRSSILIKIKNNYICIAALRNNQ